MASVTLDVVQTFPAATVVGAYPRTAKHLDQPPVGSAAASGTVTADGEVTLTGLLSGTAYTAWAEVAGRHRYVDFTADPLPGQAAVREEAPLNVFQYDTPSDDTGDARVGFNAAIADAHAAYVLTGSRRRQKVVAPGGVYRIPADTTPPGLVYPGWFGREVHIGLLEGVELIGDEAVLHMPGQLDFSTFIGACSTYAEGANMTGSNWAVRGFTFDGDQPSGAEQNSACIAGGGACNDWEVEDCEFVDVLGDPFAFITPEGTPPSRWAIRRCTFRNIEGNAAVFQPFSDDLRGFDGLIEGCKLFDSALSETFFCSGTDNLRWLGNVLPESAAFSVSNCDGALIEGNYFSLPVGSERSFGLAAVTNVTIRSNTFVGHGVDAAEGSAVGVRIEDNDFIDCDSWQNAAIKPGAGAGAQTDWKVIGNRFTDLAAGVNVCDLQASGCHVIGNTVRGDVGANFMYVGTRATVAHNKLFNYGGISTGVGAQVTDNYIERNIADVGYAISVESRSTVRGNTAASDDTTVVLVSGDPVAPTAVLIAENQLETLDAAVSYVKALSLGTPFTHVKVLDNLEIPTAGPGGATPVAGYDVQVATGNVVRQV